MRAEDRRPSGFAVRALCVVTALYLPHACALRFGHLTGCGGCRERWLSLFAVLPGFIPGAALHGLLPWRGEGLDVALWASCTLALITLLAGCARSGRIALAYATAGALLAGSVNAWIVAHLFAA